MPTREARALRGKSARAEAPRSSHCQWQPPADRTDAVQILTDQASTRLLDLVPVRNDRMSVSPFAFYRGSAAVMAADLAHTPTSGIDVQLCGDAHLSNFGGYASSDRRLVFDLNDFDETAPGPWEWDVKRLVASLEIAGRDRGFDDRDRRAVVRAAATAYRQAMREFAGFSYLQVWYSRLTDTDIMDRWGDAVGTKARRNFDRQIQRAMTKDHGRAWSRLTDVVDGRARLISDPPVLVPLSELLEGDDLLASEGVVLDALRSYRRSLSYGHRHLLEQFHHVDTARRAGGVGSVGTRTWLVLMTGSGDAEPLFLQLKEANKSILEPYVGASRFKNHGQRVVAGHQMLQASSDVFLGWTRGSSLDGTPSDFYVRQLWDWKVSADVESQSRATMGIYGQMCGWTLARGHARSGDRIAIAAYLGRGDVFDAAMVEFAGSYADQNERDFERFVESVGTASRGDLSV